MVPGVHGAAPYMLPGQAPLYPQGPPPTYDQALTHPAIVGQPVSLLKSVFVVGFLLLGGFVCECFKLEAAR